MSSLGGVDLFGSGPHRFTHRRCGVLAVPPLTFDAVQTRWQIVDDLEQTWEVSGRFVGDTCAEVWGAFDAVCDLAQTGTQGTLVDPCGVSYNGVRALWIAQSGRLTQGRVVSLPYSALLLQPA